MQNGDEIDSTSFSGRVLAIEITLYDEETMNLDGIHCSYRAGINFPAPIAYVTHVVELCELTDRDVQCYYTTLPIFSSYQSKIHTDVPFAIEFTDAGLIVNSAPFGFSSSEGCIPIIEIPTETVTTTAPPTSGKVSDYLSIVENSLFLLDAYSHLFE